MTRTRLRNKTTDSKNDSDGIAYKKQRNNVLGWYGKKKRPISVILKYVSYRAIRPFAE